MHSWPSDKEITELTSVRSKPPWNASTDSQKVWGTRRSRSQEHRERHRRDLDQPCTIAVVGGGAAEEQTSLGCPDARPFS